MTAGYIPDWWSLLTAIEHVQRVAGMSFEAASAELIVPLREGKILSRYEGQPIANAVVAAYGVAHSGKIGAEGWYRATIYADGTVGFASDRQRRRVEVWREDVLQWWPEPRDPQRLIPRAPPPINPIRGGRASALLDDTANESPAAQPSPIKAPADHPQPPHEGITAFVRWYISEQQHTAKTATKRGLEKAWLASGRKGRRDDLRTAFDRQMGDAAPKRGRPEKSPENSQD